MYFRIDGDRLDHRPDVPRDWYIKGARAGAPAVYDARYLLRYVNPLVHTLRLFENIPRPETVESLFIAYRLTKNPEYRKAGWKIFQSIEKHAKIASGGYASVLNVDQDPPELLDKMETFLMVGFIP